MVLYYSAFSIFLVAVLSLSYSVSLVLMVVVLRLVYSVLYLDGDHVDPLVLCFLYLDSRHVEPAVPSIVLCFLYLDGHLVSFRRVICYSQACDERESRGRPGRESAKSDFFFRQANHVRANFACAASRPCRTIFVLRLQAPPS